MSSELNLDGIREWASVGVAKHEDRDAWVQARRQSVGASESAVILAGRMFGKTTADVWAEKVGLQAPSDLDHLHGVRMGKWVETIAGAVFVDEYRRDTGKTIEAHVAEITLHARTHPYISCTPDYWLCRPGDDKPACILECKAPGWIEPWLVSGVHRDHPRLHHIWVQVQQQLFVTGFKGAYLIGIGGASGGLRPVWQYIEYDKPFVQAILVPALEEFWGYVEREECPPPDEHPEWGRVFKSWRKKLRRRAKKQQDAEDAKQRLLLPGDAAITSSEIHALALKKKQIDAQLQQRKNELRRMMGDADEGYLPDGSMWRRQKNDVLKYVTPKSEDE